MKIAEAVRAALALTKTPREPPAAATGGAGFELDTAALASALGYAGKADRRRLPGERPTRRSSPDGRDGDTTGHGRRHGAQLPADGDGKAAITGDFVLTADEVNPVIRSLRDGGIAVTALHSHMLGEEPRLFFMHFWANDDAAKLARALHTALGHMKVRAAGA